MSLRNTLGGVGTVIWVVAALGGCQHGPADIARIEPSIKPPASSPRSLHQRDIPYLMSLNDIPKAEQPAY